jgi:hypothetical protein
VGGDRLEITADDKLQVSRPVTEMERTWRGALQALIEQ